PRVLAARRQSVRNLLATTLLAAGVPMIAAGDELGRTQQGNNNAYCQDNEISWLDWQGADADLLATVRRLLQLRGQHRVLRPAEFQTFDAVPGRVRLRWFDANGEILTAGQWHDPGLRTLVALFDDRAVSEGTGQPPDFALVVLNGAVETVSVHLPDSDSAHPWQLQWSSAWDRPQEASPVGDTLLVDGSSLALLTP